MIPFPAPLFFFSSQRQHRIALYALDMVSYTEAAVAIFIAVIVGSCLLIFTIIKCVGYLRRRIAARQAEHESPGTGETTTDVAKAV